MATKKKAKQKATEIVVRVETAPAAPTVEELYQPVREGKELTIPKSWMNEHQITFMLQRTPKNQVYRRKGKGGQTFDYVTGSYITKALNYAFGWNWDFEVVQHGKEQDHVWVLGRLTVRGNKPGQQITKTQFGRSEVKYLTKQVNGRRERTEAFVDYGNDLKAATTDALKKCASMLGFASDIYGKADYKQESGQNPTEPSVQVGEEGPEGIVDYLCAEGGEDLSRQEAEYSQRVYGKPLCREHQKGKKSIK